MIIHQEKVGETLIEIHQDDCPENPREFCGITKMFCFHRRYELGDKNPYTSEDFNSWSGFKEQIESDFDIHTIKPLYLYDHSGITISTSSFNCQWDSGQVGWVFVTKKDAKEFGITDVDKFIQEDVSLYDKYLRGDACLYRLIQNDKVIDSCAGFYDVDDAIATAKEQIKEYLIYAEEIK